MEVRLRRGLAWATVDAASWLVGLGLATIARYEFVLDRVDWAGLLVVAALAVAAQMVAGLVFGLYTGRLRFASFEEAGVIGAVGGAIGIILLVGLAAASGTRPVPVSAAVGGAGLFVVFAAGSRYLVRLVRHMRSIQVSDGQHRAVVFGAGEGGYEAARALLRDPSSAIRPVAFLDDDPTKRNLHILGCRVVGDRQAIKRASRDHDADTLVIAIPSGVRSEVAAVAREARRAGLRVLILPRMARYLESEIAPRHIRPLAFEDFLGRDEVRLDLGQISTYLQGRRVLVTGAGGSIGAELCALVSRFRPARLFMVDRDENALARLQMRLEGRALLDEESLIVADIRDQNALDRTMQRCRPEVVFHAAALKHVTFLERFPGEAVKTNVRGTLNVLRAAQKAGVQRFINVSTDKAASPVSVLGFSKRIGEMLTAGFDEASGMAGISVRFGNVLGSQGSVIPLFEQQVRNGGPITITHPEVTRYFMTNEEAVQLVVQAGAVGRSGEVLVLDMGEPVRIVDLARELAAEIAPGLELEVEYTGLRPGEKLSEVLVGSGERFLRHAHEMIDCYGVPPLEGGVVDGLMQVADDGELRRLLAALVGADAVAERPMMSSTGPRDLGPGEEQ